MYWLQRLFRKQETERRLDSELRFHLEQRAQELADAGVAPEEARRQAQIEFGGIEGAKEECRESRRAHLIDTLFQDMRFGLRTMRRNIGFSTAAIATLALGIGASTAVFSVVESVLLKPLPYPDAAKIVIPWRVAPPEINVGYTEIPWGRLDFQVMASEARSFQSLGAFVSDSFSLTGRGDPRFLDGVRASAGFFPALGIVPELGRTFSDEEDRPGHELEVVLGHDLWRDQFGASPSILGQAIELNGASYTVIGVMPPGFVFPRGAEMPGGFNFPREAQLWVPLALRAGARQPDETSDLLAVIGRLRQGSTIEQSQAELNLFAKHRESMYPTGAKGWFNSGLVSLPSQLSGDKRRPLLLLQCAVVVVLLLACSNVAGLLLARALVRRQEFTLRSALGASQSRLLRQLITESLMLAAVGGILGTLVAEGCIRLAQAFGPTDIPRLRDAGLDPWVLMFAFSSALLTGVLFGLAPARAARRASLLSALNEGGIRSAGSALAPKSRNVLLVSQMALAVVLVVAAGLLAQTFVHLLKVDPGFNAERVLKFELSLPPAKYANDEAIVEFYRRALPRLREVAGVQSAALVEVAPMAGSTESSGMRIPDRPPKSERDKPFANYSIISPTYFFTVQTPLLRGREFLETDTATSTPVAIINQAMARAYWPGEDPIGKQVGLGSTRFPLMQIVGLVADVKHLSLREDPGPEVYVPYTQKPYPSMQTLSLVVRTKADPASVSDGIGNAIQSLDPDLPLARLTTLKAIVDKSLAQARFSMLLLGAFAGLAVVLASIGMYGVISYTVSQRTREIGIRMALGAQRGSIFAMVLGQGARLATLGVLIGLAAGLGAARLMTSFLYGIRAFDPLTFALVAVFLITIALAACYMPARRATAVQPTLALRSE